MTGKSRREFSMIFSLPERLSTARLVLRAPRRADAALIFNAYAQDMEVARYMVWRPHAAVDDTERFIAQCIRLWADGTSRPYILAAHGDEDRPVGMLDGRIQAHVLDIGYVLAREYWGSGLMPEAVTALAEAALSQPECFRVQASCDVHNKASARTLEKSGFIREAVLQRHTVHPNISDEPSACFMYARCK